MDDLVEEVRLALCEVAHTISAKMGIPEDKQVPYGMEEMNALSVAAISAVFDAIAEPSDAMIEALADKLETIGAHHGWWSSEFNWRTTKDTIGRSEWLGLCEELTRTMTATLRKEFVPLPKPPSETS